MYAVATCPASCGELIQGLIEKKEMLISYPVDLYSTVKLVLGKKKNKDKTDYPKIEKALGVFLENYNVHDLTVDDIEIEVNSKIPIGKGMASSTADLTAAITSLAALLKIQMTEQEMAKLIVSVEPTDSIIFKKLTLFDHLEGNVSKELGEVPAFKVLVLEGYGSVDTVHFRKNRDYQTKLKPLDTSYQKVIKGIKSSDLNLIGMAATESALKHQMILYRPYLENLLELSFKYNALGVNIAHSGSVVGIMATEKTDLEQLSYIIKGNFPHYFKRTYQLQTVGGGARLVDQK